MKKIALLALSFLLVLSGLVLADTVTLKWSDNTEPDLAGYRIFYAPLGGEYDRENPIYDGTASQATVVVPGDGTFVAIAYDQTGNTSNDSNEAIHDLPPEVIDDLQITDQTKD